MERYHEGRTPRGLRQRGGLRKKLLRSRRHCAHVLRHICPDGPVRVGQRSGRRSHETSRGVSQAGKTVHIVKKIVLFSVVYCPVIKTHFAPSLILTSSSSSFLLSQQTT